jgi:hypothetical protein
MGTHPASTADDSSPPPMLSSASIGRAALREPAQNGRAGALE